MDERRWSMLVRKLASLEVERQISMKEAEILMGKLGVGSGGVGVGEVDHVEMATECG
jgi:hypothetical protein